MMIGLIVGSLVLAGAITLWTSGSGSEGLKGIPEDEMQWVTCRNKDCGTNYEMQKRKYYGQLDEIQKQSKEMLLLTPPLICEKCGKESLYKAFKCLKCELVFEGPIKRGDYEDRCPKCAYSDSERRRKEKAAANGK